MKKICKVKIELKNRIYWKSIYTICNGIKIPLLWNKNFLAMHKNAGQYSTNVPFRKPNQNQYMDSKDDNTDNADNNVLC